MVLELKAFDAPPSTAQEMDGLKRVTVRYQEIMTELDAVSDALAIYVKHHETSTCTSSNAAQHSGNRPSGKD